MQLHRNQDNRIYSASPATTQTLLGHHVEQSNYWESVSGAFYIFIGL